MSTASQVRLYVTPLPGKPGQIAWEIRDDSRRLGHGTVAQGDWPAIRQVEILAGLALVEIDPTYLDDKGRDAALHYGWEVKFAA